MAETGNFSLINFDGKPIEKLIEVIGQGIGTLYKPTAIRKEAKAKAFEIEVISKAQAIANAEGKLAEVELCNIIEQKLLYQQVKKQNNIDKIIDVAIDQINQEEFVSPDIVNPDWTTRFFNIAEDISNDEMQKLWGRILSGEVKQPGSFSLRALDTLKNLTKHDAEIFSKFVPLRIESHHSDFIPYVDKDYLSNEFNISYKDILEMSELGLINHTKDLAIIKNGNVKVTTSLFRNGNMAIYIETSPNQNISSTKILNFTKIGCELSSLISFESNPKYLIFVAQTLKTPNTKITIGKLAEENGKSVLTNLVDFDQAL